MLAELRMLLAEWLLSKAYDVAPKDAEGEALRKFVVAYMREAALRNLKRLAERGVTHVRGSRRAQQSQVSAGQDHDPQNVNAQVYVGGGGLSPHLGSSQVSPQVASHVRRYETSIARTVPAPAASPASNVSTASALRFSVILRIAA